jgi:lipocalin
MVEGKRVIEGSCALDVPTSSLTMEVMAVARAVALLERQTMEVMAVARAVALLERQTMEVMAVARAEGWNVNEIVTQIVCKRYNLR